MTGAEARAAQAWTDRHWTSADGLRLCLRDYAGTPERPPILCLHGLTRNARDFEDFARRHAGEWRVLSPDFRGRGMSEWDPQSENYSLSVYAADIVQLLDELEIAQAVFVGTSLGGLVTMAIAAFAPERIVAAVLNDIGPELDPRGVERIGDYVGKPVRFDSWDSAAATLAEHHKATHPAYRAGDWDRYARRICRERGGAIEFDYDMRIADNFGRAQAPPPADAWPYYRALAGAPLLIVRGELSDLLSEATAQTMVEAHPDAQLVTVPNVGHPPELTEPEAAAAIDRLLSGVLQRVK